MARGLPIRVRVIGAFALAMSVVLAATGVFVYARVGRDLSRNLDQDLRLRAQDVSALIRDSGGSLAAAADGRLVERGESFGQLLTPRGRVLDSSPPIGTSPLLGPRDLGRAGRTTVFVDRPSVPGLDEGARLLATPVTRAGRRLVLVVGATRENRAEALGNLRTALLLAGPIALVLAIALGYPLAGAGLRAVDDMRRRAAKISADRRGERLPVPATGDELERLGVTLNEMLGRLEAALERERGFVADASHELRTPLALLRAELDFALHHADSDEELRAALREAGAETDRLVQLAASLLLIAGSDGDGVELRRERLDAQALLDSVRNRFAWRAADDGRELSIDAPDVALSGDRLRLEQALGNLVDNALRHGAGAVAMRARQVDGHVELHVLDKGPGFPAELLPRAFGRFESGGGQGAGLGLAIVDTIARAHGGSAYAENVAPGADVWIALPATR